MDKKMGRLIWLFFILFLVFTPPLGAQTSNDSFIHDQIDRLHLEELQDQWKKVQTMYESYLPSLEEKDIKTFIQENGQVSFKQLFIGLLSFLFQECLSNGKLLGLLLILAVFSAFLQTLQNAFQHQTLKTVSIALIFFLLVTIAIGSFGLVVNYTKETIQAMVDFMIACIPILFGLMVSTGQVASVTIFHPLIVFLINATSFLIQSFILPLLLLAALIHIVSTISPHYKATQLANLLRSVAMGTLGVFFTIFLGVISVQGATSAVSDGITLRTIKFFTGNFIPVVGRMFTDATDTVMTASVILKNTIGVVGMVMLFLIVAFPAIKVLVIAFIYKVVAALIQPIGGAMLIQCLDVIGKYLFFIFASLAVVSFMFFLSLTMIIASGNITLMVK